MSAEMYFFAFLYEQKLFLLLQIKNVLIQPKTPEFVVKSAESKGV